MRNRWEKIWAYLRKPPLGFLLAAWGVTLLAIAGTLTVVFIGYTGWLSYPAYVFAAILLAYAVYTVVLLAPDLKNRARARLQAGKFTGKLTGNYPFRTRVFAGCSLAINLAFVAFNTLFAVLTSYAWYGALAGYYFLLGGLRGGVFYLDKRAKGREDYDRLRVRNYRLCGVALLLLDVAMSAAVTLMVVAQKPIKYTEITAIVFASYSVYKISFAIWNIFKARKTKDLQVQAFRNIGLADAAVSLLSLQTTLIATFSVEGESMLALNAITGAFVCLFTIGLGIIMIVRSKEKKNERE